MLLISSVRPAGSTKSFQSLYTTKLFQFLALSNLLRVPLQVTRRWISSRLSPLRGRSPHSSPTFKPPSTHPLARPPHLGRILVLMCLNLLPSAPMPASRTNWESLREDSRWGRTSTKASPLLWRDCVSWHLKHVRTCLHLYIRTYVRTYVCTMHTYIPHLYIRTYVRTCLHLYIRTYICTYVRMYHAYIYVYHICTYVLTYVHAYIHKYSMYVLASPVISSCLERFPRVVTVINWRLCCTVSTYTRTLIHVYVCSDRT